MLRSTHWHPLLLGLYPALHLLARNVEAVRPEAAYWSLALSAAGVMGLWVICGLTLKSRGKGALLASLAAVLFFSHGHLLRAVDGGTVVAWVLVVGGGLLLTTAGILLARWQGDPLPWNRTLDVVALALVVMALVPVANYELRSTTSLPAGDGQTEVTLPLGYMPDIYVIILDAFGRADQLEEIYDVDLSELQDHMTRRGFRIPIQARSNYAQTTMSLAALFNSEYLETIVKNFRPGNIKRNSLANNVRHNRHVRRLRKMGYKLVVIAGGSELGAQAKPDVVYSGGALNEFAATMLAMTPLPTLASLSNTESADSLDPFSQHRAGVRYQFEKLPRVMVGTGPKLVFTHIISPHPPFVIGPDGEDITPDYKYSLVEFAAWDGYVQGYSDQAKWVAKELKKTVDGILDNSRRPPVILIMGDHGPAARWVANWKKTGSYRPTDPAIVDERMSIFLALHLPPGPGRDVYPTITPINIFPLIFERCFGETVELKDDRSFFSTYDNWSTLYDVDNMPKVWGREYRRGHGRR